MTDSMLSRLACMKSLVAFLALATIGEAQAGSFAVREQSAYFMGSAFAGSAAGADISSIFWNSAATATLPGFNTSSSYTAVLGQANETATGGVFVTGIPSVAPGLPSRSTDVGTDNVVPASYATYQVSDRLYVGFNVNSPFGFITKPDNLNWAGSPVAETSKVFSADVNPTIAYKITPEITIGAGIQVEYLKIRLNRDNFLSSSLNVISPARSFNASDWGAGATAGIIWQPLPGTSLGLGYRSSVDFDVSGLYSRSLSLALSPAPALVPGVRINAAANVTLPDEVTFSFRQVVSERLTFLGTVEWENWSRLQNVTATAPGGLGLETLNFNYQDGWFFSLGAEYIYNPQLTFRTGIAFERSPVDDDTRSILLPDSDRIHLNIGATYRYSDRISVNFAYSHLFFDDAPFCIANPAANGGTTHCNAGTPASAILLTGASDNAVDLVSVGLNYKVNWPLQLLEPFK
jgi:long-chain fatty acid transport protein